MAGLLTGRSLYRGSTKKAEHFYSYDNKTGNLTWRSLNEDEEYYTYDDLDRLTETSDDLDNIMLQQAYATSGILRVWYSTGAVHFAATYDAWGKCHPYKNDIAFQCGYTGHEMLPEFGLINMNGRMYDPLLGRFLSPDNYVQMPDFSQNFNRYSYCLNNPLKYVDLDGEYGLIDDLSMSYDGNRLKSVSDAAAAVLTNGSADFKDGSASATEYSYNATGALTEDKNKGISAIEYDNFCCPRRITFTDGNATEYIYTQSGQKLAAIHRPHLISVWGDGAGDGKGTDPQGANTLGFWDEGEDGLPVDTTEYLGCFVLRNGQVERILFNGGYVTLAAAGNGQVPAFHYYTFDHLGNVRAVYDEAGEIEQLITYDPFGAVIPDLSQNMGFQPYKYNGKELDRTFGLDWYDYGARNYDAAISRWDRVDPLCEKYYNVSPYMYCAGNPVNYLDLGGDSILNSYDSQLEIARNSYEGLIQKQKESNEPEMYEKAIKTAKNNYAQITIRHDKINTLINEFKNTSPNLFKALNNMKYNTYHVTIGDDGIPILEVRKHNLDVSISLGTVAVSNGPAHTVIPVFDGQFIKNNLINTVISEHYENLPKDILPHELGHAYLIGQLKNAYKSCIQMHPKHNCQVKDANYVPVIGDIPNLFSKIFYTRW